MKAFPTLASLRRPLPFPQFLRTLLRSALLAACSLTGTVGAGAAPAAETTASAASFTRRGFSFGFVTDTHITSLDPADKDYDRTLRLREVLDAVARSGIDFIIHGGDAVETPGNGGHLSAFNAIMKPTLPWYPIAGNHDIDNVPRMALIEDWLRSGHGRGPDKREFYGFDHKGAAFYVLNTFADRSTAPVVLRRADDQLADMDAFFARHKDAPLKIVCGHAPLFIKSLDEADEYFNIPREYRLRVADVMKKHGVSTYLCGHRHLDYVATDSGIIVYTQTALSFQLAKGGLPGYYIFRVDRNQALTREFTPVRAAE